MYRTVLNVKRFLSISAQMRQHHSAGFGSSLSARAGRTAEVGPALSSGRRQDDFAERNLSSPGSRQSARVGSTRQAARENGWGQKANSNRWTSTSPRNQTLWPQYSGAFAAPSGRPRHEPRK